MKEKEKLGQEPAFPLNDDGSIDIGMSKRFYAATKAMQGLIQLKGNEPYTTDDEMISHVVQLSYMAADELLKQENE